MCTAHPLTPGEVVVVLSEALPGLSVGDAARLTVGLDEAGYRLCREPLRGEDVNDDAGEAT